MTTYGERYEQDYGQSAWDPDLDEKKDQARNFIDGLYALQEERQRTYLSKKLNKKTAKYNKRLADAGYTPEQLQALYNENPGLYDQAMDYAFKSFNKVIKTAAKGRKGPARASTQPVSRARRPEPDNLDMDTLRKKARTTGLHEDEMDAILDATLGDLFQD